MGSVDAKEGFKEEWRMSKEISKIKQYFDAVNYITVAQLYLEDNFLVSDNLSKKNIKKKLLGHRGTAPNFNYIYAHLNAFVRRHRQKINLVIGAGHASAALISNLYLKNIKYRRGS